MRTMIGSARCRLATGALLWAIATVTAHAEDQAIERRTMAGQAVLVRGFAEFGGDCTLRHVQTITIVAPPANGRVETRPGDVTIGDNWVGNKNCAGTTLAGVRVWYVPAAGFTGVDRFSFDVRYQSGRTVRATVEVRVE